MTCVAAVQGRTRLKMKCSRSPWLCINDPALPEICPFSRRIMTIYCTSRSLPTKTPRGTSMSTLLSRTRPGSGGSWQLLRPISTRMSVSKPIPSKKHPTPVHLLSDLSIPPLQHQESSSHHSAPTPKTCHSKSAKTKNRVGKKTKNSWWHSQDYLCKVRRLYRALGDIWYWTRVGMRRVLLVLLRVGMSLVIGRTLVCRMLWCRFRPMRRGAWSE